ncbi:hypothetical protein J6590_102626 [Homalodisca vitripennis]|nr:hypothetical protein J6590_102626 [Homalodisca vitripennis]
MKQKLSKSWRSVLFEGRKIEWDDERGLVAREGSREGKSEREIANVSDRNWQDCKEKHGNGNAREQFTTSSWHTCGHKFFTEEKLLFRVTERHATLVRSAATRGYCGHFDVRVGVSPFSGYQSVLLTGYCRSL